jgi:glutathione S-transferase
MTSIKLYFAPYTRATRPRWLLEELGVPYELVRVDMKARAHKTPAYIADVHPHGAVPAAEIDGQVIIESAAIIATLADLFPDKGLAPAPRDPARARYYQWLFYGQATVEPAIEALAAAHKPDSTMTDEQKAAARERWGAMVAFVEKALGQGPWILGQHFSAADCVMGALLLWAASMKALDGFSVAQAYAERCRSRPAFQAARK